MVVSIHRVVEKEERQEHDERRRKREPGYHVDRLGQMDWIS